MAIVPMINLRDLFVINEPAFFGLAVEECCFSLLLYHRGTCAASQRDFSLNGLTP